MGQTRWVSYIFRYRDGARCENAGFIKVQQICRRSDEAARIQIGLRLYKRRDCKCKIFLIDRNNQAGYLDEMMVLPEAADTIEKKIEFPWKNCLGDGLDVQEYAGLAFLCDDGEILAGLWGMVPVEVDRIKFANVRKEPEEIYIKTKNVQPVNPEHMQIPQSEMQKYEPEKAAVHEIADEANEEAESETAGTNEDMCRIMIDTFPKLPLFPGSYFLECVKIAPQDIGKLPIGNWRLGSNSFLSHGYYQYRYLMLGILRHNNKERYVVGIPGVYNGKEKYLANMFGFGLFVPVRPAKVLTGSFGYWIWEVSSV